MRRSSEGAPARFAMIARRWNKPGSAPFRYRVAAPPNGG
jgi:hypothetical protein